jgi:hypothetical protein
VVTTFQWQILLDGEDITPLVLDGESRIQFGRRSVTDPAAPIYGTVRMLSSDVSPNLSADYPEFGVGPQGQWEDIYVDEYSGTSSRITLGSSAQIIVGTGSAAGWTDTYVDEYHTGSSHKRLTGYVSAIEYDAPYTITLTIASKVEAMARYEIPGPYPTETDSDRMTRLGVDTILEGTSSTVIDDPDGSANCWKCATKVAASTGGLVYCDRDNQVVYRQPHSYSPRELSCPDCAVLIGPFKMITNLGSVQNTAVVTYGNPKADTTSTNEESVTAYGPREIRTTTVLADLEDAQRLADEAVALANQPGWALPDVQIMMGQLTLAEQDDIANLSLDDRLNIGPLLDGAPTQNVTARILGYSEVISRNEWTIDYHLAPDNQAAAAVRSQ